MQSKTQTVDVSEGLDELLEIRVRNLSEKLSRPYTIEEIKAELATLNDLVYSYKRRDELLEKLLDTTTTEEKRRQIRAMFETQRIRLAERQAELERLHARSHQILQQASLLITNAQEQINKKAHRHTGYAFEPCGRCKGIGFSDGDSCVACNGKGSVLVHQPALKCPRCGGDGKPTARHALIYSSNICVVCRGTGWVLTKDQ